MKRVVLVIALVLFITKTKAQQNGIYHNSVKLNPTSIVGVKATAGLSMYLTGLGTIKTKGFIVGPTASTNISPSELEFTAYFEPDQDDFSAGTSITIGSPSDLLLFKLTTKRKQRQIVVGTIGTFSGSSVGVDTKEAIAFTYEDLGEGMYKIIITGSPEPGEYGFLPNQYSGIGTKVWDFTIL